MTIRASFMAGTLLCVAGQLASAELRTVPTYENCSLYLAAGQNRADQLAVRYRRAGDADWTAGHPLVTSQGDPQPRGSLFGL